MDKKIKFRNKHHGDSVRDRSSSSSSSSSPPRLTRSRSASPAINISFPNSSRVSVFGTNSKTTLTKIRRSSKIDDEQVKLNSIYKTQIQKRVGRDDDSRDRVSQQSKIQQPRKTRSASSSPSAWALSPGRVLHPPPPPAAAQVMPTAAKSPIADEAISKKRSKVKGVSGVLKYFRPKKISHIQEEEYHQFRIIHNRLLQWRFANARAEASMAAAKRIAERKLFNAWAKITVLRKVVVENRIQIQRLKQEIKLHQIVGSQLNLLKEWGGRLENKNSEAVGRLARKLTAISICLPLIQDAKVDMESLHNTMEIAMKTMESIKERIDPVQLQAEKLCYLSTELSIIMKEEADNVKILVELLDKIAHLEATERSLKVHLVQLQ